MIFRGDYSHTRVRVGSGARSPTATGEALRPHDEGVTPPSDSPTSHRHNTTSLKTAVVPDLQTVIVHRHRAGSDIELTHASLIADGEEQR